MSFAGLTVVSLESRRADLVENLVRDEGGIILPFFNQFIDATGPRVAGWIEDPHQELMNGYALSKCWVAA